MNINFRDIKSKHLSIRNELRPFILDEEKFDNYDCSKYQNIKNEDCIRHYSKNFRFFHPKNRKFKNIKIRARLLPFRS